MNAHPHGEQLSAYLDGMLGVAQMRDIAAHLGACPACRAAFEGLKQTKALLGAIPTPAQPAPEFWTNAYRRMRVEDAARRPTVRPSRDAWRETLRAPQRRWSAGLATVGIVAAAIAGPLVSRSWQVLPRVAPTVAATPADTVDVSSLVQAHTESAAHQPLADADRQDMIAMDDSFKTDDPSADTGPNAPDSVSDAIP